MSTFITDIKYAWRMLAKRPGFTAIALITLAVGIGANTIMFSLVNILLFRQVQIEEPDRLVECHTHKVSKSKHYQQEFDYLTYQQLRDQIPLFSDMLAQSDDYCMISLMEPGKMVKFRYSFGLYVSSNYFSTLGMRPQYGRTFTANEEHHGAEPIAILSHRLWQRQGGAPEIIGKQLMINSIPTTVIGVAPEQFTGTTVIGPELWLPLGSYAMYERQNETKPDTASSFTWNYPSLNILGRLKPGLSLAQGQAQWQALTPQLREICPEQYGQDQSLYLHPLARAFAPDPGPGGELNTGLVIISLFLLGVSLIVLLIACLNLANMVTIQGTHRTREIAIRLAVGAGRLRIMGQLLLESVLLAGCGGLLGLLFAHGGTALINHWISATHLPMDMTGGIKAGIDVRVLGATVLFCLIATVLFGLKPAFNLSQRNVVSDLKESSRNAMAHRSHRWRMLPRNVSLIAQIALSVILVMGAALFAHSAYRAININPGYPMQDKLVIELDQSNKNNSDEHYLNTNRRLLDYLRSLPEVQTVAVSNAFTFSRFSFLGTASTVGSGRSQGNELHQSVDRVFGCVVGPDYFRAMDLPFLEGQSFNPLDQRPNAENVVVIDASLAHQLYPSSNALGRVIQLQENSQISLHRIIGIVPDLRPVTDDSKHRCHIYKPIGSDEVPNRIHVLLASMSPSVSKALLNSIGQQIKQLDPSLPIISLTTLTDYHRREPTVSLQVLAAHLALTFGLMALFLASLGIYAIRGYSVATRTPEIGLRKALGATQLDIIKDVLSESVTLTLVGLALGLSLSLAGAHLLRYLFYGINPIDPTSITMTAVVLASASLLAGVIPARRATKIDPMEALRYE